MDHRRAPVREALAGYHRKDRYGFSPPGHRRGRGVDEFVHSRRVDLLRHPAALDHPAQTELQLLERAVKLAEAIAPTGPHAGVESMLANAFVGPFASMADRARDAILGYEP